MSDQAQHAVGRATVDRIVKMGGEPIWAEFTAMHPDFVAGARERWTELQVAAAEAGPVTPELRGDPPP